MIIAMIHPPKSFWRLRASTLKVASNFKEQKEQTKINSGMIHQIIMSGPGTVKLAHLLLEIACCLRSDRSLVTERAERTAATLNHCTHKSHGRMVPRLP